MSTYMGSNRGPARWWLFPLLAFAAVVSTVVGLALYFHSYAPPPISGVQYSGWWFGWPFFGFGWFLIPLFFIVVFFGFRWFFWGGWGWRHGRNGGYYDPALEMLREMFARGEITKAQFDSMAKDLEER